MLGLEVSGRLNCEMKPVATTATAELGAPQQEVQGMLKTDAIYLEFVNL